MSDRDLIKGKVPSRLPLIILPNEVLLPTVVAHIKISLGSKSSGGLVQHLSANGTNPPYVAVVPLISRQRNIDDAQDEDSLEGLHSFGTIAQVNGMGHMIQAGVSSLAIEGVARIQVSRSRKSASGNFHIVDVKFPTPEISTRLSKLIWKSEDNYEDDLKELFARTKYLLQLMTQETGKLEIGTTLRGLEAMLPARVADSIIGFLASSTKDKLEALEAVGISTRIRLALRLVQAATESIKNEPLAQRLHSVIAQGGKNKTRQKRMLRMDDDDGDKMDDIDELLARINTPGTPEEVIRVAEREGARTRKLGEHNPAYSMATAYLDVLADLPWSSLTKEITHTLVDTQNILDLAHYGLEKIKDRLVQHVAVQKLRGTDVQSPILCFVGPPGVGKTSLAQSVADVLGKPYVRISLGGVRDEAEIRGHRKTYIGAMPGRILNGIKRVGVRDPVVLLDEVDKMGHDVRGDPSSALLEVLDPEQNHAFVDTYVGLPFDLSRVVFIATANRAADIPPPLLDRLEVIQLPGYTVREKIMIAQKHLLPKVFQQHGLQTGSKFVYNEVVFSEDVMKHVIVGYTREAGVRGLERCLAAICRYCVVGIVSEQESNCTDAEKVKSGERIGLDFYNSPSPMGIPASVSPTVERHAVWMTSIDQTSILQSKNKLISCNGEEPHISDGVELDTRRFVMDKKLVETILGPPKYLHLEESHRISEPGVAAGLVWTPVGGLVQYIECCCTGQGKHGRIGQLTLTGQLGDVLEESAHIALSWIRSNAAKLGLMDGSATIKGDAANQPGLKLGSRPTDEIVPVFNWDIHVHLPSGGIPKDGPSAGVTIACTLLSLLCGRKLRADTAMTGELTLRGIVLAVGGVKEKCIAAHQAGLTRVLLPNENVRHVRAEVSEEIQKDLEIVGVTRLSDVIASAFNPPLHMMVESSL